MPMVRMPISLAMPATTGPAPVPVPPPMPAVTKTILVPSSSSCRICSVLFSASWRPHSGSAPAPRPVSPSMIFTVTGDLTSDCVSVLHTAKVTLLIFSLYMLRTALQPPPPTPMTLMMPFDLSIIVFPFSLWFICLFGCKDTKNNDRFLLFARLANKFS